MAVLRPGKSIVHASSPSRIMVIGGAAVGRRHIWWSYVHSSKERIDHAKRDWVNGVFERVPGDAEFILLPGD